MPPKKNHEKKNQQLLLAAQQGKVDKIRELLDLSAHINYRDEEFNMTPIDWAAFNCHEEAVDLLLERDACIFEEDLQINREHKTTLHYAVRGGNKRITQKIHDRMPQCREWMDRRGFTPLGLANEEKKHDIEDDLRKLGSSILQLAVNNPVSNPKTHCPRTYSKTIQSSFFPSTESRLVRRKYDIHLQMTHHSKTGEEKISLSLAIIHRSLREITNAAEAVDGNSNIAAAKITFEIATKLTNGRTIKRRFVTFDLRIPGSYGCYNYNSAQQLYSDDDGYGKDVELAQGLLYQTGRRVIGIPANQTHGTDPKHGSGNSGLDQFLRHSEHELAAYLAHPDASVMLVKRLIAYLRGENYALMNSVIKIYSVILHIDSTKSPCGACEYVLIGLQNLLIRDQRQRDIGLLTNLAEELSRIKTPYHFIIPGHDKPHYISQKKGIRMFTTFTAHETDTTHPILYNTSGYDQATRASSPTLLELGHRQASKYIHYAHIPLDEGASELSPLSPNMTGSTIFLSASNSNPKTKKTVQKITKETEKEMSTLYHQFADVSLVEEYDLSAHGYPSVFVRESFAGITLVEKIGDKEGNSVFLQLSTEELQAWIDEHNQHAANLSVERLFSFLTEKEQRRHNKL